MEVRFSKQFTKQLAKQPARIQELFYARLTVFMTDASDVQLRNHRLQGKLKKYYSINITGDVRALYEIIDSEIYLYQMISSHSQLY